MEVSRREMRKLMIERINGVIGKLNSYHEEFGKQPLEHLGASAVFEGLEHSGESLIAHAKHWRELEEEFKGK